MGISRSYLLLFCAVVALLGLAVLAITTGVLVYPITRPIPAWYVYAAGYFISITLLIFAPLGVSRSSTFKASRKGVSGVLLIAVIYAGLTVLTGLWLSSWAHDFFEVRREGFDSRTLSKPAMAIVQEIEKKTSRASTRTPTVEAVAKLAGASMAFFHPSDAIMI